MTRALSAADRPTNKESDGLRAAMVHHYATTDTLDRTEELKGYTINDWIPMPPG